VMAGDITFTAVFVKYWTVTFELQGGAYSGNQTLLVQTVDHNANVTALTANPTRLGHNFLGWFTAAVGGTLFDFSMTVTEDITLYARWSSTSGSNNRNNTVVIAPDVPPLASPFMEDHIWYARGFPDGTFNPNAPITRAEISMILWRLIYSETKYLLVSNDFSDVGTGWYAQAISYLAGRNIVTGYPDGMFRPNAPITRAELTAVMSRFFEIYENGSHGFSDVSGSHWAISYINNAVNRNWILGYEDGSFGPDNSTTRAEAVTIINRVLGRIPNPATIRHKLYPFLEKHFGIDRLFYDLTNSHWAYYQIMEAATNHEFVRDEENLEIWEAIYIPWLERVN